MSRSTDNTGFSAGTTVALAERVQAGQAEQPALVIWPENASDIDPFQDPAAARLIDGAARAIGVSTGRGHKDRPAMFDGTQPGHHQLLFGLWREPEGCVVGEDCDELAAFADDIANHVVVRDLETNHRADPCRTNLQYADVIALDHVSWPQLVDLGDDHPGKSTERYIFGERHRMPFHVRVSRPGFWVPNDRGVFDVGTVVGIDHGTNEDRWTSTHCSRTSARSWSRNPSGTAARTAFDSDHHALWAVGLAEQQRSAGVQASARFDPQHRCGGVRLVLG